MLVPAVTAFKGNIIPVIHFVKYKIKNTDNPKVKFNIKNLKIFLLRAAIINIIKKYIHTTLIIKYFKKSK